MLFLIYHLFIAIAGTEEVFFLKFNKRVYPFIQDLRVPAIAWDFWKNDKRSEHNSGYFWIGI